MSPRSPIDAGAGPAPRKRVCPDCGTPSPSGGEGGPCPVCCLSLALEDPPSTVLPEPRPGDVVGRWRLESQLGQGGMGTVFRAESVSGDGMVVAIKLLSASLSRDEIARFRFGFEASHRFVHPNLVSVLEGGEHGGRPYLVMPYHAGGSLARVIATVWRGEGRGDFGRASSFTAAGFPVEVARLMATIARAVGHAHDRGIIHRDLKPANILLDAAGQPHVSDFGISRRLAGDSRLTALDAVLGSPGYMAPELAEGSRMEATVAGDVYGLGAILYELLTGLPPHEGPNVMATLRLAASAPTPSPRRLNPRVPVDLDTVCRTALSRDPASRYPSARQLAEDLERFARGEPVAAPADSAARQLAVWARRNPLPARMAVALVLVLVGAVAAVSWQWRQAQRARVGAEQQAEQQRQQVVRQWIARGGDVVDSDSELTALAWLAAAWRSDAAASVPAERLRLHEQRFAATLARLPRLQQALRLGGGIQRVAVSPDGLWLAASVLEGPTRVLRLGSEGGDAIEIPEARNVLQLAFNRGSSELLVVSVGEGTVHHIRLYALPSGQRRQDWRVPSQCRQVALTPDGARVASASQDGGVRVWDTTTGALLFAQRHDDEARRVCWSPGGDLFSAGWDGRVRLWNGTNGVLIREWESQGRHYVRTLACSPRGDWMAFGGDDRRVTVVELPGGRVRSVLEHPGWVRDLHPDADGSQMATGDNLGNLRLWNPRTGEATSPWMSIPGSSVSRLAFNPEGTHLGVMAMDRTFRIWSVREARPVSAPLPVGDYEHPVTWLTSNRVVIATAAGACQTWRIGLGLPGRRDIPVGSAVQNVTISPDGRWLAGIHGASNVMVADLVQRDPQVRLLNTGRGNLDIRFHPVSGELLTISRNPWVRLWDPASPARPRSEIPLETDALGATFGPQTNRVLTATTSGRVQVWERPQGSDAFRASPSLDLHVPPVVAGRVQWSPDGRLLAMGNRHLNHLAPVATNVPGAFLWRFPSGEPVGKGLEIPEAVEVLAFSPDSRHLAIGCLGGSLRIFDTRDGHPCTPVLRHALTVNTLEFDASGGRLFSGSYDQSVRVWDVATGDLLRSDLHFRGNVRVVQRSPDGQVILVGANDGTVGTWDLRTLEPVIPRLRNSQPIRFSGFSPSGRHIYYGGVDLQIHLIPASYPPIDLETAESIVAALSPMRVDAAGRCLDVTAEEAAAAWSRTASHLR